MRKKKPHMIISIDAEKSFEKIQYPFVVKMFNKLGVEENFLNLIQGICKNPTANIILNGERLKTLLQRLETRQECLFCHFYSTLY